MKPQLIIALDVPDLHQAVRLAEKLRPVTPWMKVGLELFTAAGPEVVAALKKKGCSVFLDLKFHDIPNTVRGAVRSALAAGADICDLHLSGGESMCRAGVEALCEARASGQTECLLLGITVLTSMATEELGSAADKTVLTLAGRGKDWGLDGVVCSGQEAAAVKAAYGREFVCLCPGIRPAALPGESPPVDDQRRTLTPGEAVRAGADFLVVGRPVSRATDPVAAARRILNEMSR